MNDEFRPSRIKLKQLRFSSGSFQMLEDEGYSVIRLSHPVFVNDLKTRTPQPSLFVLDIMLPTMSGVQLARRLREDGYGETPMIAMSASPSMLLVAEESELFQHWLSKPFDLDTLLEAVEHHLREYDVSKGRLPSGVDEPQ